MATPHTLDRRTVGDYGASDTDRLALVDSSSSLRQYACAYLQSGWHMVMMASGTKGPTHAGWNTPSELISTPERALERLSHGPQNMGLVHRDSKTCAIDVDHEGWTRFIWEQFGLDYDDIMGRGMRIWSKAGRDKVIFTAPELPLQKVNWPLENATKPTDLMTIFELRAGPNQDVLPPSIHPDGHSYLWWPGTAPWERDTLPSLPDNVLQFWLALADRDTGLREEIMNLCSWKQRTVGKKFTPRSRAASSEHSDVVGQFNQANDVSDMLQNAGYKKRGKRYLAPTSSTVIPGVVVLDDKCYSHHGSDLLADGYSHDAFDLLVILGHGGDFNAALKDAAGQLGIERKAPAAIEYQLDLSAVLTAQAARLGPQPIARLSHEALPAAPAKSALLPIANVATITASRPSNEIVYASHLLSPPGMAGTIVEWMNETARQPLPILSVAATLSLMSVVLGQRVATPTNARTNNYFIGLAETGFGKEHGRDCIKLALEESGLGALLGGEEFASGAGLLSAVAAQPVILFLVDEIGGLLEAVKSKNSSNHEKAIADILKKLFSSSKSIYRGKEYADKKLNKRIDIPFPNACMYGTTVPKRFYDNLDGNSISDGFLNRLLIVEAPSLPPVIQKASLCGVPPAVVAWLKAARAISPGLEDTGRSPVVVPYAPMAETLLQQFENELRDRGIRMRADPSQAALADIWARAYEHAIKIALVLACGRETDPDKLAEAGKNGCLEIDITSVRWAIDFVKTLLRNMEHAAATRMGESDLDRQCQDALRFIVRAKERGCTVGDLNSGCRSFRALEPRIQDVVLEMLKRRGAIQQGQRAATLAGNKAVAMWVSAE